MTTHPLLEITEGALDALARDLPAADDPDGTALLVEKAGDALRAGLDLPAAVARWLRALDPQRLSTVLDRMRRLLESTGLPAFADEHEALTEAATARDRSESVAVAVRRACIGAGRPSGEVPGFTELLELQQRFDDALAARTHRAEVEGALGIRRALLRSSPWTDALPEADGGAAAADDGLPLDLARAQPPAGARPSDAGVLGYVSDGEHAGWVEGFAATHPDFAEELEETIAVMRQVGEPVGLTARRWQAGRMPSAGGPGEPAVVIGLNLKRAAADAATASEAVRVRLGRLGSTEAVGRLIVSHGSVTLRIRAEAGSLRSVRLDEAEATAESAPGLWTLERSFTEAPMTLVVEATDGARFESRLSLKAGPDAP
jgi:hypothetical protein